MWIESYALGILKEKVSPVYLCLRRFSFVFTPHNPNCLGLFLKYWPRLSKEARIYICMSWLWASHVFTWHPSLLFLITLLMTGTQTGGLRLLCCDKAGATCGYTLVTLPFLARILAWPHRGHLTVDIILCLWQISNMGQKQSKDISHKHNKGKTFYSSPPPPPTHQCIL